MDDDNNVEQMEQEEHGYSSDDDIGGGLDLNKEWVNYRFSDVDDDDDIASVDHLSEEEDEIREVRLRKINNDEVCPTIRKKLEINKEQMRFWRVVPNGGDMFEVRQGLEGYVVDTREKTCTYRIWQLSGIPCPHAVAAIHFIHMEPEVFVSDFFSRSYFIATYNHKVNPLNGFKLWPKTNYVKPLPPRVRRMPGRPSISRKKDASESGSQSKRNKYGNEEVTRAGRQMTCKNCWEVGHNSRGCKNQKRDGPIKQRNPIGRPKGKMSQVPEPVSESGSRGRSSRGRGFVNGRSSRGRGYVNGRSSKGRRSMGSERPELGVGEAMVGSSQVIVDKDVHVLADEGGPLVNEPTGIIWSEFSDILLSEFKEDDVQLDATLRNGQD